MAASLERRAYNDVIRFPELIGIVGVEQKDHIDGILTPSRIEPLKKNDKRFPRIDVASSL